MSVEFTATFGETENTFNASFGETQTVSIGIPGEKGEKGDDGISVTHSWNGTVLTVISASGASSADLKGEKGDKGDTGEKGEKGDKGDKGDTGAAGSDYVLTNTDKQEIAALAAELVPGGGGSVELDTTLSVSGKAADAKAVGEAIAEKVNIDQGAENTGKYLAVGDDGKITLVDAPASGGDDSGGTDEPVETPLAVTWANGSVTGGVFTASGGSLAYVGTDPTIDGTKTDTKIIFKNSADYVAATPLSVAILLYSDAEGQTFVGEYFFASGAVNEVTNYEWQAVDVDTEYLVPSGYYFRVFMGKGYYEIQSNAFASNANLKAYVDAGFVEFYSVSNGSASATGLSVDDDYTSNYGISATSLVADEITSTEAINAGIDETYANVVISAANAWMKEYRGNVNKIPVILHTDQHGRLNDSAKPIFNLLNSKLNWYEVSKIMNLGDTVGDRWVDADSTEPLLECGALENMLSCLEKIPYSKRLDVFGNHDTWYTNADGEDTVLHDFSHLSQYFKNIYARRTNNMGYFTVRDDYYNVKYVVIGGFEYDISRSTYRISTAQMEWVIEELGKDDGYDVVVVSHVPLYYQPSTEVYPTGMTPSDAGSTAISRVSNVDTDALFNARKNKTTGTVTDSDGKEHSFDFSGCTTEILCGLHGHIHIDSYNYAGGNGLLSATFDWFDDNTLHFVLVDRENRLLNVWKVDATNVVTNYQIPMEPSAT